jgi:hypothetical protein
MLKVELNNMYMNIWANNGSEKLYIKKTATYGKLIKAVYVSYVYVCIRHTTYHGCYNAEVVQLL